MFVQLGCTNIQITDLSEGFLSVNGVQCLCTISSNYLPDSSTVKGLYSRWSYLWSSLAIQISWIHQTFQQLTADYFSVQCRVCTVISSLIKLWYRSGLLIMCAWQSVCQTVIYNTLSSLYVHWDLKSVHTQRELGEWVSGQMLDLSISLYQHTDLHTDTSSPTHRLWCLYSQQSAHVMAIHVI